MASIVQSLWLIPATPLLAGGVIAVTKQRYRLFAQLLAIASMSVSFLFAVAAFVHVVQAGRGDAAREVFNFNWFQAGHDWIRIGWVLDPLNAVMLVMVTFVGLLIFIYSVSYMADDENVTRFFGFLSLFAGAMLGVLISNSLLTLFMCWEIVGLTSYLLIGFWFARPSAAAAAKKAFVVTRIGDLGLFLGIVWLYAETGTLLFYDGGRGCMDGGALAGMGAHVTSVGMLVSTAIGLLIFCGAAGKSGQFPLHVWLPDAMEGPTPVSALIHAATMVAAGVFLVARVYPLMHSSGAVSQPGAALQVVTWIGALTALFGALVAVAQWDIKRILAYSTVSQLGYMMIGIGTGGVAVGMFHLITHAFFKALLFLGAGSVIHGCGGEQDIRKMGGLRRAMPWTFAAYTCGMLALSGFPLLSGFWSKDAILDSAAAWSTSRLPFYMGALGAFLTAFYMTRQMFYIYAGSSRLAAHPDFDGHAATHTVARRDGHESPAMMVVPLLLLSIFAVLLGFIGTTAWPWFQAFLDGGNLEFHLSALKEALPLMLGSSALVFSGLSLGWLVYGRATRTKDEQVDPLEARAGFLFHTLNAAFYINEFYSATIVRLAFVIANMSVWMDSYVWGGALRVVVQSVATLASADNRADSKFINGGFDSTCAGIVRGGKGVSTLEAGQVQRYLRSLGLALILTVLLLIWGGNA
jgi:NADH-quinone oxidoreductase subunit L